MEFSVLQTTLVSLIGTVGSIALALGAFTAEREQLLIGIAGTLISLGFSLYTEIRTKTKVQAAVALKDQVTLKGLLDRL